MSALAALQTIFAGQATPLLLQDARLQGLGGETYGRLAIGECARAHPGLLPGEGARVIEAAGGIAVLGPGAAVWADVYDGYIHRLWRLGALEVIAPAPFVSVPADPDRAQTANALAFRAADHPDLDPAHAALVPELALATIQGAPPHHRARMIVVRAHSQGDEVAVLGWILVAGAGAQRHPLDHFVIAAAHFEEGVPTDTAWVTDTAGLAAARGAGWQPRV